MDFILALSYNWILKATSEGCLWAFCCILSTLLNCFDSERFPSEQSTHFLVAGIEIDMFKEIIVLDMVTASIILGKW